MSGDVGPEERARLVGLCAHLTGDREAAEDLAHEVLLVALERGATLRDPGKRRQWMSGIARNVCRRWTSRKVGGRLVVTREERAWEEELADAQVDVERELERAELLELLDRALGRLPAQTRRVLVARLAEELPGREVAARLGMSETAVATRLGRGKAQLRRELLAAMPEEAAAYGLLPPGDARPGEAWAETRIWCPACGDRRLLGRWASDRHGLWLRCHGCPEVSLAFTEHGDFDAHPGMFDGVRGFKPALNRVLAVTHELHARASAGPAAPCPGCGVSIAVAVDPAALSLATACPHCGSRSRNDATHLALALPEVRAFWREHGRMRAHPPRRLDHAGRDAVLLSLEDVRGASRLHVVLARSDLRVLAIRGDLRA